MTRSKNKKKRSYTDGLSIKNGDRAKSGHRTKSSPKSRGPRPPSDFCEDLGNLKMRMNGPKKVTRQLDISLSHPTFIAPSIKAEATEREASKARDNRMKTLFGDKDSLAVKNDIQMPSYSLSKRKLAVNRFFGLDIDGEVVADESARVTLAPGILDTVVRNGDVEDRDDDL